VIYCQQNCVQTSALVECNAASECIENRIEIKGAQAAGHTERRNRYIQRYRYSNRKRQFGSLRRAGRDGVEDGEQRMVSQKETRDVKMELIALKTCVNAQR